MTDCRVPARNEYTDTAPKSTSGATAAVATSMTRRDVIVRINSLTSRRRRAISTTFP